ncbi:hypothetical protein MYAM1_004100 [Malassezia yamatoensis]|uniref:Xylanolytic transcriptional activator regulatory domain-containing protein n=1 Tax=Malassezia yamatoensis TaxID=253288 RepID=A0AAJ6CIF1_9BASI|nr:hypothetical protein MYAM1_004100 [Malassezia yamatoensis]
MTWKVLFVETLRLLPSKEEFFVLFDYYLQHIEPVLNYVNSILMREEIEMLYKNVDSLRVKECSDRSGKSVETEGSVIDSYPSFWTEDKNLGLLSVAYAITYFVYDSMQLGELQNREWMRDCKDSEDKIGLMEQIYAESEYQLRESEYRRNPTLWTIQAILLQQRRHFRMKDFVTATLWHSTAVRLAQSMGLNRLGDTKADLEYLRGMAETPSKPEVFLNGLGRYQVYKHNDAARREVARKVWTALVTHDWLTATQLDLTYCVSEAMHNTSVPAMLSDREVLSLAALPLEIVEAPLRSAGNQYLEFKMQMARNARRLCETCCESIARMGVPLPSYEIVQKIDHNLRAISSQLPEHLVLDYAQLRAKAPESLQDGNTSALIQRLMLHETLEHQLLSLHTIYLKSGLEDMQYQRSVVGCIEAASNLLTIWGPLQLHPIGKSPQLKWHLLVAGGALAYVVGAKIAHGETDSMRGIELESIQNLLEVATDFLEKVRLENNVGPYGLDYSVSTLRQYCRVDKAKSLHGDSHVDSSNHQVDQVTLPDLDAYLQGVQWLNPNEPGNHFFLAAEISDIYSVDGSHSRDTA